MLNQKGCWTCKDRKVSCDRAAPACQRCTKSKRTCGGYGMRLTWPKQSEEIGPATKLLAPVSQAQNGNMHFVNVVSTDVRLHLATVGSETRAGSRMTKDQLTLHAPEVTDLTDANIRRVDDEHLLHFFRSYVIDLLPSLGIDRRALGRYLSQKAQNDFDKSASAVRHSMLALASYFRGESRMRVEQFKQIAIEEMYTHVDMTACEAGGHVAANVLLCILEMQQPEDGSSAWIGYVCSFKEVLHVFAKYDPCPGEDSTTVLALAYYADTMARFGIRHWRTEHVKAYAQKLGFAGDGQKECYLQYLLAQRSLLIDLPNIAICAHSIMRLLAEVFSTIMYSGDRRYKSVEYQEYLDGLRSRLVTVSTVVPANDDGTVVGGPGESDSLLELTRLAAMIYLERVSRNFSGQSHQLKRWTQQALSIISRLDCYAYPFPMFVVGCETCSDEDRIVMLDFYARVEMKSRLPHLRQIKSLLQTAWNQQDLQEDANLEYIAKINLVMSTRDIVPCFI